VRDEDKKLENCFSDIKNFLLTQVNDVFIPATINNRYPMCRPLTAVGSTKGS